MSKDHIRQFKLNTGEELICEVLQWDDEENPSIIIRSAMRIVESVSMKSGLRLFSFQPWMSFQDDSTSLQTLCSNHIIGEASPSNELLSMYVKCLKKYKKFLKGKKHIEPLDLDELDDYTDQQLQDFLDKEIKTLTEDSDNTSNIIPFKPKTFH